jgi:hypothetical protein
MVVLRGLRVHRIPRPASVAIAIHKADRRIAATQGKLHS